MKQKTLDKKRVAEELDRHFLRCYTEFPYYAEHNLKVLDADDSEVKAFKMNDVQEMLEEILEDIAKCGRLVRLYLLKARRQGLSTWSTGRLLYKAANKKNKNAVIIAHEPAATDFLFEMCKRYYNNLPPEFKPEILKNSAKLLQFNNETGTGLDSSIRLGTAGVKDFGSGQGIHYLLLSEMSKFPRETQEDLVTSVYQTVPATEDTAIICESTAKGIGGEFYKGFYSARYVYEIYLDDKHVARWRMTINPDADQMDGFSAVFIPWFAFSKYRMEVPAGFKLTHEETVWQKTFNLDLEQIAWYRWALPNKCRGDENRRAQEYPFTAKSAFIGSGTPTFNVARILYLKEKCLPPVARYECLTTNGQFVFQEQGRLSVWEEPLSGRPYVISADVAEGLAHGDYDSASVWDHQTGMQVAHFRGHMDVFEYAEFLYWLGKRYNCAWIVPERNNNGLSTVRKLMDMEYPNLYVEMVVEPPEKPYRRFGWVTSKKSRDMILNNLIYQTTQDPCPIRSPIIFDEMLNFKIINGRKEADPGTFDDTVLDVAIGLHVMQNLPFALPETTVTRENERVKPNMRAYRT